MKKLVSDIVYRTGVKSAKMCSFIIFQPKTPKKLKK